MIKTDYYVFYRDCRVSWLYFEFCQRPDVVGKLDGLVDHVLALQVSLGNREHVVLLHLGRHAVYQTGKMKNKC